MPYIKRENRGRLDYTVNKLAARIAEDVGRTDKPGDMADVLGKLNYCITQLCLWTLPTKGHVRYSHIAMICGVLDNVKMEFYRRFAVPYEDEKIKTEGDVY